GDPPLWLIALEPQFLPPRRTQLARADEQERRELQRIFNGRLAAVGVDRAQELADQGRLSDRRMIRHLDRSQRSSQVRGDIALGAARRDRIAEHLSDPLLRPMRRLMLAAGLEPAHEVEHFRSRDLPQRPASDVGVNQILERPTGLLERLVRELLLWEPLLGDRLEGVSLSVL